MFKANDLVLYGAQGVCRIQEIATKTVDGQETQYYSLRPVYAPQSSIFVPVDNEKLTGRMRRMLTKAEIQALIDGLPSMETIWIPGETLRKEKYKAILLGGDRLQLCALIKTLYLHRREQQQKSKKLHINDERYLKEAEKVLYSEFALVLDKKPEEIPGYIEAHLTARGEK